ncbi:hypothetical protein K1719_015433 [Acacia pycnantha]|nr:hypothetical protein K1719_015433 [Acacia pycnantha]
MVHAMMLNLFLSIFNFNPFQNQTLPSAGLSVFVYQIRASAGSSSLLLKSHRLFPQICTSLMDSHKVDLDDYSLEGSKQSTLKFWDCIHEPSSVTGSHICIHLLVDFANLDMENWRWIQRQDHTKSSMNLFL